MNPIYLDNNSTTNIDPEVLKKMIPFFESKFGNASSVNHAFGSLAKDAIDKSRRVVSRIINSSPNEIIFTSGATESLNLAIKGLIANSKIKKPHIVTFKTEHKAVLDTCVFLESSGVDVDYLDVASDGSLDIKNFKNSLKSETVMVVLLHANNEIGTIHPIKLIGEICNSNNIPLLVDAAQSFGKIPIDVKTEYISMLAGSAHKVYGPKGVGFLYKKNDIHIESLFHGGGHEMGYRSGTINVPGIVGLTEAAIVSQKKFNDDKKHIEKLSNQFLEHLNNSNIDFFLNGPNENRLIGNLNITLVGVDATWLTTMIPNIAFSRGSACTSETIQPSHVLRAIGLKDELADGAIRISIGRFNTMKEIDTAANIIIEKSNEFLNKKITMSL